MQWPASELSYHSWQTKLSGLCPLFHVQKCNTPDCLCRLLQRPTSLSGAAAQAGLAAGRADAAGALMEGMPAGLRRIAGQAAQLLTSHVSLLQYQCHLSLACASCIASMTLMLRRPTCIAHALLLEHHLHFVQALLRKSCVLSTAMYSSGPLCSAAWSSLPRQHQVPLWGHPGGCHGSWWGHRASTRRLPDSC